jgi:putative transcriptional regulator
MTVHSEPALPHADADLAYAAACEPVLALFLETVAACRGAQVSTADAAGGALLERQMPVAMGADALSKVFAAIDRAEQVSPRATRRPADFSSALIRLPPALAAAIREAEEKKGWSWAGPGIRSLKLSHGNGLIGEVMRIAPGAGTPVHSHRGREATLCLAGGFTDRGKSFGPGDVSFADASVIHRPIADADGPCYVLAITDGGLKFTGLLGALQKLVG